MTTLKSTFDALDRLRGDVASVHAGLLKHERTLAHGHQHDAGHAELYGFIHRMARLFGDMQPILMSRCRPSDRYGQPNPTATPLSVSSRH